MAGGRYFADPPHTLGEGEEEENEEIGWEFLVAFGFDQWLASTVYVSPMSRDLYPSFFASSWITSLNMTESMFCPSK